MKKIPTLFERTYENGKVTGITENVKPGFEWVLAGDGTATAKFDGACCAVISGELYKRYDAKKGKKPPEGAIPCCDPDPITGHWPHWVKVDKNNPGDKWFAQFTDAELPDGTYEAVGKHFNGNPYLLENDMIVPHGKCIVDVERTFNGIKEYLLTHNVEGIVFWKDGKPQCKIKRRDFGFRWPCIGDADGGITGEGEEKLYGKSGTKSEKRKRGWGDIFGPGITQSRRAEIVRRMPILPTERGRALCGNLHDR